jgi:hypothetical protein
VGVQTWRLHRSDARQVETALALTNEKAAHDTTRALSGRQLAALRTLYGDSLAAVTHLLEQRPPRLCNPDLGKSRRHWSLGITAGYGGTLAQDSTGATRLYRGPSMTVGLTWTPF